MTLYNQPSFDEIRELFAPQTSALTLYITFPARMQEAEKKNKALTEFKSLLKEVSPFHFATKDALEAFKMKILSEVENKLAKMPGHGRSIAIFASASLVKVFSVPNRLGNYAQVKDTFFLPPIFRLFAFSYEGYVLIAGKDEWDLFYGSNTEQVSKVNIDKTGVSSLLEAANKINDPKHQIQKSVKDTMHDALGIYVKRIFDKINPIVGNSHLVLVSDTRLLAELKALFPTNLVVEKSLPTTTPLPEIDFILRGTIANKHADDVAKLGQEIEAAKSKGLFVSDLSDIAAAAVNGRVNKLIMHYDYSEHGRVDMETGSLILETAGELSHDIVVATATHKGLILAFRPEEINHALEDKKIAAVLRF